MQDAVLRRTDFHPHPTFMRYPPERLGEHQAVVGRCEIDTPSSEVVGQGPDVKGRVIPAEG